MKKFLFILFLISSNAHIYSMEAAKDLVHYFSKRLDPDGYILDLKNQELYENLQKEMEVKDIGELMRNESFSKGIDKQSQERIYYLIACLLEASKTQSHKNLESMIKINLPLVSDLHLMLAMKALGEHGKKIIDIKTEHPRVNALLYRFNHLPENEQKVLKQTLRIQEEALNLSQKIQTVEQLLEDIPVDTRINLFSKFIDEQKVQEQLDSSYSAGKIEDSNAITHQVSDNEDQ
ncbi:MAG TPA: hypothetical protein PLU71_02860 [Candidatus Dependentiae bacterium]|nr:hypothetical protein [Candidatus Dependentiae bacterium]HRQ62771.1 hypothetical protein [Candidatus Dependentiae bacterium]